MVKTPARASRPALPAIPLVLLLAALLTAPWPAAAHAFLERAVPPVGGTVPSSPAALDLFYTEGVVPHFSSVEVRDQAGRRIATGKLTAARGGRELVVPVPALAPGQYTVIWHVTSQDTHKTEGKFSFSVGK